MVMKVGLVACADLDMGVAAVKASLYGACAGGAAHRPRRANKANE